MKSRLILLSAFCCICFLPASNAFADDLWTLKTCIAYAVENNPDLQASKTRISISTYDFDYQHALFLPHLDFVAATGYLTGEPTSSFAVVRDITNEGDRSSNVSGQYISGSLTLSVPLLREGVFFARNAPALNIAASQITEDKGRYEAKKSQIIYEIGVSFFSLLKNMEDIRIAEEHLKSLRLNYETAQSKYREDLLSKNELLVLEVKLAEGEKELVTAVNSSRRLNAELSLKLGLEPTKKIAVSDENFFFAPVLSLDELLDIALANRQEMKIKESQVWKAKEEELLAKSKIYPNIDFVSSYSVANDYGSRSNSLFTSTVQLSMPLFDSGATKSKVASRQLRVAEEQNLLLATKHTIEREVIISVINIQDISALIALQEKIVAQHKEESRLMKGKFEQNLVPLSAVLEAEYSLHDSQKALAQQKYDLRLGYMQLAKALGSNTVLSMLR